MQQLLISPIRVLQALPSNTSSCCFVPFALGRLVKEKALLETLLGVLTYLMQQLLLNLGPIPVGGRLSPDKERFQVTFLCYRRVLSDLNTILHHPPAVAHLLEAESEHWVGSCTVAGLCTQTAPGRRMQDACMCGCLRLPVLLLVRL